MCLRPIDIRMRDGKKRILFSDFWIYDIQMAVRDWKHTTTEFLLVDAMNNFARSKIITKKKTVGCMPVMHTRFICVCFHKRMKFSALRIVTTKHISCNVLLR